MNSDHIVIAAARRTPIGAFQGALAGAKATELGSAAIRAAISDSGIDASDIDETIMGCPRVSARRRRARRRSGPACLSASPAPPSTRCAVRA